MNLLKIQQLRDWMQTNAIEVAYLTEPGHIAYLTGYHSDPHERILALFIPLTGDPFLFTPALETEDAKQSGWSYDVVGYLDSQDPWHLIAMELENRFGRPERLAIEKNALTIDRLEELQHYFPTTDFSSDLTPVIQRLQLIKTPEEKEKLLAAGAWADVAFEIGFQTLTAGVSEQEVVAEIEYQLKRRGVSQMSFETIVLFGKNAASPHGNPGAGKLTPHNLVLFDLGVVWEGYCSDATRTVAFHTPTDLQVELYELTLAAQSAAQKAVKPGVTASELDGIARQVITEAGYGEYFNHRLGHGIGTTVHEFPSLVAGNDLVIEEGMCFSLEPGIYLPEKAGVRIEDCVYVTSDGCLPLTSTSKELTIIE